MKYAFGTAALALVLAGCGGTATDADADGDGKVSASEAEAAMAATGTDIRPEPGKYKANAKFVKAEGLPAEMEKMMSGMMTTSYEHCITEEMAEKGFEEMMKSGQEDGCSVERMKLDGGNVDMAMTCAAGAKEAMKLEMKGKVTSTSSEYTTKMSGMIGGMSQGSITVDVKQERIGDCDS